MGVSKIAIIGAGTVGSTIAYTLIMGRLSVDIVLVDVDEVRCAGEVDDLADAIALDGASTVSRGTVRDAASADIIIIAAGVPQKPGQKREDLLEVNKKIITEIVAGMGAVNSNSIVIVVTNPVDIITRLAQLLLPLPVSRVFGSGTLLDTQRLRHQLAQELTVAQNSIHVYVLGEHGDSQFVAWSGARIGERPLQDFSELSEKLQKIAQKARDKAYNIIACKGATAFGIAACVQAYCIAILQNSHVVMPVSCYVTEFDVCLSMPVVLGKNGIERIIIPELSTQEQALLKKSVVAIQSL